MNCHAQSWEDIDCTDCERLKKQKGKKDMNKATMIIETLPEMTGDMAVFKLEPPYEHKEWEDSDIEIIHYVAVSCLSMAFDTGMPETYIFPCDAKGNITSWGELEGSFRGGGYDMVEDRMKALNGLGYEADRYM
jgi:hypothetical protein